MHALADAAGLQVDWTDASDRPRRVAPPVLRAVLATLGLPAATVADCSDSMRRLREGSPPPPLLTAQMGVPVEVGGAPGARYRLQIEGGAGIDGRFDAQGRAAAIADAGYHTLLHAGTATTLAVAPPRCYGMADACGEAAPRRWGVGVQVYAARGRLDAGIGDADGVAEWVERVGRSGGDAVALSPLHAPPPPVAERAGYSPYSPGDRRFLDPLYAAPARVLGEAAATVALESAGLVTEFSDLQVRSLVDWPRAARAKWSWLRALHRRSAGLPTALREDFLAFCRDGGKPLERHARFMAAAAGDDGDDPVALQRYAQWLATRSWSSVQDRASASGMALGLVADLAVGFDPAGAEAAANPETVLRGLVLGAPPDAFNARGQVWGITSYAPAGLRAAGYAPFVQLLRAVMRDRGGIRIDHILGLLRLWVVPEGGEAGDGVYLRYPCTDLLRLLALESWRQRVVVVGEDLGVVPAGFRAELSRHGVLGTDVLLFARDPEGAFLSPARWRHDAAATTTTHDLPPLAGWRGGRDLAWRARLDAKAPAAGDLEKRRDDVRRLRERVAATLREGDELGDADDADELRGWLRFVARAPSPLALLPIEDALALEEQPNLPGTVEGHPNWRRRLPDPLPEDTLVRALRAFATERATNSPGAPA